MDQIFIPGHEGIRVRCLVSIGWLGMAWMVGGKHSVFPDFWVFVQFLQGLGMTFGSFCSGMLP